MTGGGIIQYDKKSELAVVTKAKELCSYIMEITQKSPKQFRFTFVTRLQNLSLDVIECIYYANEIFIGRGDLKSAEKRLALQHKAMTTVKLIAYVAEMSMTRNCILSILVLPLQTGVLPYSVGGLAFAWFTPESFARFRRCLMDSTGKAGLKMLMLIVGIAGIAVGVISIIVTIISIHRL